MTTTLMLAAADTVIHQSPWTPTLITALFAGIAFVIAALGKVLVDLKSAEGKAAEAAEHAVVAVKAADEVKQTVEKARVQSEVSGKVRDHKLDEIKMLVDGKFSLVLDKVAALTRTIADDTGLASDIAEANAAEDAAARQRDKVLAAGVPVAGVLTVRPDADGQPQATLTPPPDPKPG